MLGEGSGTIILTHLGQGRKQMAMLGESLNNGLKRRPHGDSNRTSLSAIEFRAFKSDGPALPVDAVGGQSGGIGLRCPGRPKDFVIFPTLLRRHNSQNRNMLLVGYGPLGLVPDD